MKPRKRIHPHVVVREISPHKSERSQPIRLIVLHSTESHDYPNSPTDLEGVAGWFSNPASEVSAHVIVDDDGNSARCVNDADKAWHVYLFNSYALGIEQVGFAAQGKDAWREDDDELHETARWIAHFSLKHEIPIRGAEVSGTGIGQTPSVVLAGVTTHARLGHNGGDHGDPGEYPFAAVLELARGYKAALQKEKR